MLHGHTVDLSIPLFLLPDKHIFVVLLHMEMLLANQTAKLFEM